MRLTDVRAYALSSPIDPPDVRPFYGGKRRILKRDVVLVSLETADGLHGVAPAGASSSAMREYFEGATQDAFVDLLEREFRPRLEGITFDQPTELTAEVTAHSDIPRMVRSQVASAIDVAAYDLLGRERGIPIFEILLEERDDDRSAATPTLPLYASAGMYMSPAGYAQQAAALKEQGFSGYKYRPRGGPDEDRRSIAAIREAVGSDMRIMVDAHTWWKLGDRSYSLERVESVIDSMAAHDPYWIEEPVAPDDHDAYRTLADRVSVPLAGGESEESPAGLRRLGETGVSFLQADVRHHEGYTGCRSVAEWCAGREVQFVPHHFGTDLGLVANAHLVAAMPEAELLEYPVFGEGPAAMYPFPLAKEILETSVEIRDGTLAVPTGPGLGVDVDWDVIERYPFRPGPWTEFTYDEPASTSE